MINSQVLQFSFVLMCLNGLLLVSATQEESGKLRELASVCDSLLVELNKDFALTKTSVNEASFNKCLTYYLAKLIAENHQENVSNEEINDEENEEPSSFLKLRETRRAKNIKQFWKRRAGGTKKFW